MSSPAVVDYARQTPGTGDPRYSVGTLRYTAASLATLFAWLLWGDFCFTLMEAVIPSIIPLRLKELEATDWTMAFILSTIPGTLNFILNPIISTASDRHRGRLGRRLPFLLVATPLVSLALVLLAFSPEIAALLHLKAGPLQGKSAAAVAIITIGILMATFKFFDMFINTVFWYLFNDVVPQGVMARFMGLFRMIGSMAGSLYAWFCFENALDHMRFYLLAAAALYLVGFTSMCLGVREGKYPPPEPMSSRGDFVLVRIAKCIRTYVRECLCHRLYAFFFLHNVFWSLAGACGLYGLFLNLSLGLSKQQIGRIAAVTGLVNFLLQYPAGALADRFHPLRMMLWMKIALVAMAPLNLIWIFGDFTSRQVFYIMIALTAINIPLGLLYVAVLLPMQMRILPRDRFGQFCSFNAISQALFGIGASLVVGSFMGRMRDLFPDAVYGKDYCYRLIPLWNIPFLCLGLLFMFLLYREWKRLGGDTHYAAPTLPVPAREVVT